MALLSTQTIVDAGTQPTLGAASTSDTVTYTANTFLVYANASGSSEDITVVAPGNTDYGVAMPDNTISLANGAQAWIPLRKAYMVDSTGLITVTMASATGITVAAVRFA